MATSTPAWSLQARVQLIAFLALCIGLAVGSASMFHAANVQSDEDTDERVELLAKTILVTVVAEADHPHKVAQTTPILAVFDPMEKGAHQYQVWTNNGAQLLRSFKAPQNKPLLPLSFSGYRQTIIDGIKHCTFTAATSDRSFVVQVAEPTPSSDLAVGWLASKYLTVALLPFLLILLFNRILLRKSFEPIEAVREDLSHRSPSDARQLDFDKMPREIAPLVLSLNSHLQRLGNALSVESRFTSVAAHELKTPLAGIRAQAQMANQARNPEELRHALDAVLKGVDTSSRIIDQLISLHKLESVDDKDAWQNEITDLGKIQAELLSEFEPKAKSKGIKLKLSFDIAKMRGHEFAVWTLLSNLIRNAIQYTPENGQVDVRIKLRDFRVVLTVDDSGPGIAEQDRQRAMEKFQRLGRRGSDGVGLGLCIVSNVANLHQAVIQLRGSPLGGLRVEVQFHSTDVSETSGKDHRFLITAEGNSWHSSRP